MKHTRFFTAFLFVMVMSSSAFAQIVSPVDFMRGNPRMLDANPASFVPEHGYFDFLLGGFNIGVQNIGLKYDSFFRFNNMGQPIVLDLDKGVASLRDVNYLNNYFNLDVFSFGRRTKHGFFTYTHKIREIETFSYSKDLVQLLAKGNSAFLGARSANIDLGISERVFQEFDFGYQMCLLDELNVGVRLKFLMGLANVKSDALNIKLYTDADTYALSLLANGSVNATVPYGFEIEDGQLVPAEGFNVGSLFKNYGAGIDLGAEYKIDDQIGVAAAINDLGMISWKTYSVQGNAGLQNGGSFYHDGAFVFQGITQQHVDGIINDPNYLNHLVDSLSNYFQFGLKKTAGYKTGLTTNMMVRGYYDFDSENRLSAQIMGYNMGLGMKPAMTIAYTGTFGDKYDVVATYTMMQGSFDNIGVGLSANFGGLLLYIATNNLFGFFNPANISQMNLQFGISFTAGEKVSRDETIVIKREKKHLDVESDEESEEEVTITSTEE